MTLQNATEFHRIAILGIDNVLREAVYDGFCVNAATDDGMTALHYAAIRGCSNIVNTLIQLGADTNAKTKGDELIPLHVAADCGNEEILSALNKEGTEVTAKLGPQQCTAIHRAASRGSEEIVNALIGIGANIEDKDISGSTPLHYASFSGNIDAVQCLLDGRAECNAKNKFGLTPLMLAAVGNVEEIGYIKASYNWDIHLGLNKRKPSFIAMRNTKDTVVKKLIENSASVTEKDTVYSATALHWAAANGSANVAKMLILKGASSSIRDNEGNTPFSIAIKNSNFEFAKCLIDNGHSVEPGSGCLM